jgi:hypothetical protein
MRKSAFKKEMYIDDSIEPSVVRWKCNNMIPPSAVMHELRVFGLVGIDMVIACAQQRAKEKA